MDEPLGALDLKLRREMQLELKAMQQKLGITFIYVTHDQEEALTMSDTVVVMNNGRIQQIGDPKSIYDEPKNAFVADFIGESNIFDARMIGTTGFPSAGTNLSAWTRVLAGPTGGCGVRPEDWVLGEAGKGALDGVVESAIFKGVHYEMMIRLEAASCARRIPR